MSVNTPIETVPIAQIAQAPNKDFNEQIEPINNANEGQKLPKKEENKSEVDKLFSNAIQAWSKIYNQKYGTLENQKNKAANLEKAKEKANNHTLALVCDLIPDMIIDNGQINNKKEAQLLADIHQEILIEFDTQISYFESIMDVLIKSKKLEDLIPIMDFVKRSLQNYGIIFPPHVDKFFNSDNAEFQLCGYNLWESTKKILINDKVLSNTISALKELRSKMIVSFDRPKENLYACYLMLLMLGPEKIKRVQLNNVINIIEKANPKMFEAFKKTHNLTINSWDIEVPKLSFGFVETCMREVNSLIAQYNEIQMLLPKELELMHSLIFLKAKEVFYIYENYKKPNASSAIATILPAKFHKRDWKKDMVTGKDSDVFKYYKTILAVFSEVDPDRQNFIKSTTEDTIDLMLKRLLPKEIFKEKLAPLLLFVKLKEATDHIKNLIESLNEYRNLYLEEKNKKDKMTQDLKVLSDQQQAAEKEKIAATLQQFKLAQSVQALSWKTIIKRQKEIKSMEEQFKTEIEENGLADTSNEELDVKESLDLKDFEVQQLLFVQNRLKDHMDLLQDLFDGKPIKYSDIKTLVNSIADRSNLHSGGIIVKSLKLISHEGSHFNAFIPNTHKEWPLVLNEGENGYQIQRKLCSTMNSWNHTKESHSDGTLSAWARERCVQGFIRAGITPNRLNKALSLSSVSMRKSNA